MITRTHAVMAALVPAALVLAAVPLARAQALDAPFLALFPELRHLPAPDWVQPGVRMTYDTSSATIAEEPGEQGNSGAGYIQVDVIALSDAQVALNLRTFSRPIGAGAVPGKLASYVGPAGAGCDFYVNPEALKRAPQMHAEGFFAFRSQYPAAGKQFDAIHLSYTVGGTQKTRVYDSKSGVLLHWGSSTEGGATRSLGSSDLRSIRTLQLPWAGAPLTQSFKQLNGLRYTGRHTSNLQPGFAPQGALLSELRVQARGANWLQLKHHYEIGALARNTPPIVDDTVLIAGAAQLGGVYIPPKGLQGLAEGQLLDRDPVTGFETRVAEIGGGPGGGRAVTIEERSPSYSTAWTYDAATGWLLAQHTAVDAVHMVFDLQLDAHN